MSALSEKKAETIHGRPTTKDYLPDTFLLIKETVRGGLGDGHVLDVHGKIIAGERINGISIGASKQELLQLLPETVNVEILEHATLYASKPWKIWVDTDTQKVTQVSVGNGFGGKFLDTIGIGSTLAQLKDVAGPIVEDADVYMLKMHPGICFELEDAEDWNELEAPIEFISVFQPSVLQNPGERMRMTKQD